MQHATETKVVAMPAFSVLASLTAALPSGFQVTTPYAVRVDLEFANQHWLAPLSRGESRYCQMDPAAQRAIYWEYFAGTHQRVQAAVSAREQLSGWVVGEKMTSGGKRLLAFVCQSADGQRLEAHRMCELAVHG